jgi:hypothetical protein
LQDSIASKIFPAALDILEEYEEAQAFIDRLNKLEKLGLLPNVEFWQKMRKVRNELAHEYPDDLKYRAMAINDCYKNASELLVFWDGLSEYVTERINNDREKT